MKDKLIAILGSENVFEYEPMSRHTTFRVGGNARFLVEPTNEGMIADVISLCQSASYNYYIIGNGSNLLVKDEGFDGVIIKLGKKMSDINIEEISDNESILTVQAGALMSKIGKVALEESLTGFEFATGIPGTIGGGAAMNAGAYGGELKDVIESVRCISPSGEIVEYTVDEMDFSYRHSVVFEKNLIVTSVKIKLHKGDYKTISDTIADLAARRKEKQPLEYPSAGSTFKRPEGYFAGKLIQDSGLRGFAIGGAQVSEKHCGFVINKGGANAQDVLDLIKYIQKEVKDKYGVDLEPEVRVL